MKARTQDNFRVFNLSSCNLSCQTNKICFGSVLLLLFVSELTKTPPQNNFLFRGTYFYNLLFETNNFCLCIILPSRLASELQKTPSPGIKLNILFRSFDPLMFFLGLKK